MKRNLLEGGPVASARDLVWPGRQTLGQWLAIVGMACGTGYSAWAQTIDANATISSIPVGLNYDYTITLNNTASSTSPIETLWYAWVPGADFLPSSPITVQPPSGWSDAITGGSLGDGYGIEFFTTTTPLNPGNSFIFEFESADTPAQLAGNSPAHPGSPVGTSYVYSGIVSGAAATFVVQPVPEPSSLALLLLGGLLLRQGYRRSS